VDDPSGIVNVLARMKTDAQLALEMVKDTNPPLSEARAIHSSASEIIGWLQGIKQQVEIG
jgi:hypothetical protein